MNSALTVQPTRLGNLIRRLSTPHEGERLNVVAALERYLGSRGRSFHDLAEMIERPAISPQIGGNDDQWRWLEQCLAHPEHFSAKEIEFLRTARDLMASGHELSPKQSHWLAGLHTRLITRWRPRA